MKPITITAPGDSDRLSARDWQDLRWLLDILDEWLLYAEPPTLHELTRSLQARNLSTTAPQLLARLGELRRRAIGDAGQWY